MTSERFLERRGQLAEAIQRLEEALAQPYTSYIRDSVIQRFEFSYELAWKTMRLWLEHKEVEARTPKEVLTASLQMGLITDHDGWQALHETRNSMSHTYSETDSIAAHQTIATLGVPLLRQALDALQKAG